MKKTYFLIMILMMMAIKSALAQQGENLIQNGTFEQGNVGFKSDFRFFSDEAFDRMLTRGTYTVMDSFPYQVNRFSNHFIKLNSYGSFDNSNFMMETGENPERTSTGNFLAGNVNESGKIWYDSITIKPNTVYSFSCIAANVYYTPPITVTIGSTRSRLYNNNPANSNNTASRNNLASPGDMKLCVNGKKVSKVLRLSYDNKWRTLSGTFTSGPDQTRIEISIQDQPWSQFALSKSSWSGSVHYAALDNIVFKEIKSAKKIPPVKKDTASQFASLSADFKKNISIDEIKVDQKLKLSHIYFKQSKYNLLETSLPELNDLAAFMKKHPTVRIRLEGHTDNQGDPKLNVELSENRAKEVKKYLVEQGIDENRIDWIGYGGKKPMNSNGTEYLRQKNRRVEVVIIDK